MGVADLMPLALAHDPGTVALLSCPPARRGVVSWNSDAAHGALDLRVHFTDGTSSPWLPYVEWNEDTCTSRNSAAGRVRTQTDVILSDETFDLVEVRSTAPAALLALATPFAPQHGDASSRDGEPSSTTVPCELDVPEQSQYVVEGERGWCSPTSIAMILRHFGHEAEVATTAAAVYDVAYAGTGNWPLNVAHAARAGLSGFVTYLRGLDHAARFVAAGIPPALSIAWREGELDGAPLASSDGHFVVLRGFDDRGNPIVNDPAAHPIRRTYARAQFARAWLDHGGVAYVLVRGDVRAAAALANA